MRLFRILSLGVVSVLLLCDALYSQPASSPWPMFQYSTSHVGKSPYSGPALPVLHWSYHFFGSTSHTQGSPSLGSDGRIYTAGGGNDPSAPHYELNRMYCLNTNGTIVWSYASAYWSYHPPAGGTWNLCAFLDSSPAISSGGDVYFGCKGESERSFLYALDSSGALQWSYRAADGIYSSSNLGANGEIYFQAMKQDWPSFPDQNFYALNSNGSLIWSYWKGASRSSPAIWYGDGSIVTDGVFLFNSNGSLRWSYDGVTGNHSPSFGASGRIYTGSVETNSNVYVLDSNGTLAWSYMTIDGAYCDTVTADESAGRVYAGSILWAEYTPVPQKLYALSTEGSLEWSYRMGDIPGSILMGTIVLDSAGRIYHGSVDDRIYAWNTDGALLWSYRGAYLNQYSFIQGGPAISSDGKLYISDDHGVFYALYPTPTPTNPIPPEKGNLDIWCVSGGDDGPGTGTVIRGPNGTVVLFDEGGGADWAAACDALLASEGITVIDHAIATHYDGYHIGGLDTLTTSIAQCWDRGGTLRHEGYGIDATYLHTVNGRRNTVTVDGNSDIDLGDGAILRFLSVGAADTDPYTNIRGGGTETVSTENDKSITALITYGGFDFYVGGDAEGGTQKAVDDVVVTTLGRSVDVLHVDRHAASSRETNSQIFLETMDPEICITSIWNNTWGYPTEIVMDRIDAIVDNSIYANVRLRTGSGAAETPSPP
ncbi:MAG: hypothetical protein P8123_05105, partial [bacterium]